MAIDLKDRGTIGCAYFSTEDGVLFMSEDISNATLDEVEQYITQIEPTTVLVPGRTPEELLDFLEQKSRLTNSGTRTTRS